MKIESITSPGYAAYGGMPVHLGYCNGYSTKLNCGTEDFILLVARADEIENNKLDTSKVKTFRVPAGSRKY